MQCKSLFIIIIIIKCNDTFRPHISAIINDVSLFFETAFSWRKWKL